MIRDNHISYFKFRIRKLLGKDRKIFVLGRNKTGTTSLKACLEKLGYCVADQAAGELFVHDYAEGKFERILSFCESAEVFQDAPFSWPNTYIHVFEKYPNAKYILLERESSLEWYDSLVRFHQKILNLDRPITAKDLKNSQYRKLGFLWEVQKAVYQVDEKKLYDKQRYLENYESHNRDVKKFFGDSSNFLHLVLSNPEAPSRLAEFLGHRVDEIEIPHLNRSK